MSNFVSEGKRQVVEEIHRPARINFKRQRTIIKGLKDLYQADLCELGPYAKENKGYRYILVVINCFSKYVWAYPLKTKTGKEVADAMQNIFKDTTPPKLLQSDQGPEFVSKEFQQLLKKHKVKHYYTFSEKKAAIVERVIKTLKSMLWKQLNLNGSYKWYNLLANIVSKYNNKKHRTIGMKPCTVTKKLEKYLLKSVYSHIKLSKVSKAYKSNHLFIRRYK